jgi:hypothetical protein
MRGGGRFVVGLCVVVGLTIMLAQGFPAVATAAQEKPRGVGYVFLLDGTNGHRMLVAAGSKRADGVGEISVLVGGRDGLASYTAPATVTDTEVHADLGNLGTVALTVVKTGRTVTRRPRCGGRAVTFEVLRLAGNVEFHGEEGYTEAHASEVPIDYRFYLDVLCGFSSFGEVSGPGLPGAHLEVRSRVGSTSTSLDIRKNGPGKRTLIDVAVSEQHGAVEIGRTFSILTKAGAFLYEQGLDRATVKAPAPFSGHASFNRAAIRRNRWTGNLTVDLPGRSNVPLTGARTSPELFPAHWSAFTERGRPTARTPRGESRRPGDFATPWVTKSTREIWPSLGWLPASMES